VERPGRVGRGKGEELEGGDGRLVEVDLEVVGLPRLHDGEGGEAALPDRVRPAKVGEVPRALENGGGRGQAEADGVERLQEGKHVGEGDSLVELGLGGGAAGRAARAGGSG